MTKKPQSAQSGFIAITLSIYAFVKTLGSNARSSLFAFYYPKFIEANNYNNRVVSFRKELFADINTITASDRQNGLIRILEVGVGPGCNLEYFPKQCRFIALDKNVHFKATILKSIRKHPGIILENFINECGENMSSVPSNSIDVVVSSHLHCSVDNSQAVLKEIRRVLVPGGRYYFFEHVLDESDTVRYKWQTFINKIGLWKFIFHGCTFVDFKKEISKANFFKCKTKRYEFPQESWTDYAMYLVVSHVGGCATKIK